MVVPSLPPADSISKASLRAQAKARRAAIVSALSDTDRAVAAAALAERVVDQLRGTRVVAAYLPIGSEIDTLRLIDRLVSHGAAMALPHVEGREGLLRFLAWTPGEALIAGPLGLRQPDRAASEVTPDIILTPLLAFDASLRRLGYGAGHYDRAFAALPGARRIGLAWSGQQVDYVPADEWDVPLHAVATEKGWIVA